MAFGFNNIFLIGRVGRKPEARTTATNKAVVTLSLATDEYGGKDKPNHVEWHNVTLWEKQAEFAMKHIDKGDLILVEGSIRKEEYEKDGVKRQHVRINCKSVHLLVKKQSNPIRSEVAFETVPVDSQVTDTEEIAA